MVTTKGIIEKVEVIGGVTQYRVRMPLFHETENSSDVTTSELPLAIYPLPPHMEKTVLNAGDVVLCTLEDGNLDTAIILGLIPYSAIPNTFGSENTESKMAMEEVDTLSFNIDGSAVLPYNLKIMTSTTEELIEDNLSKGQIRNYVNGEDISYLRGLTEPLIDTIEKLTDTLNYLEENLLHLEVKAEMISEGTP